MNVPRVVPAVVVACVCAPGLCWAQAAVRSDAALQHFTNNVAAYMELRQRVSRAAEPDVTSNASTLERTVGRLADRIRAARPHAQPGEIFTADVSQEFCDRISRVMHERGIRPSELLAEINDETADAAAQRLVVNGPFEWRYGSSMPPEILEVPPPLPDGLEYRFVHRDLALVDVEADLVVDLLRGAAG